MIRPPRNERIVQRTACRVAHTCKDDETFPVPYGGNPDLEPETGHSFGAGLIYTPVWAKGLSASIDYFQVELSRLHLPGVSLRSAVRVRGARHEKPLR